MASGRHQLLYELLRDRALACPCRTAYSFIDEAGGITDLSYGQLFRQARAIAAHIQQLGGTGERALLLYPPGLDFVAAFLGCLSAGVVAVPVQPMTSERGLPRLLAVARDARAKFALTSTRLLGRLESSAGELPELDQLTWIATDQISPGLAEEWRDPHPGPEALAFLQYTSGSTASPKGVMVSHGNLLHNEEMIQSAFGQSAASVIVGWLPLYHDMGLIGNVLQPLHLGAHAILMSPAAFLKRPVFWLETITRYRGTTSGGPNFAYELCSRKIDPEQRADLDLSSWEVAFNGAEPVRSETLERFARTFEPQGFRCSAFYPCYGLAEATLFVTGGGKGNSPTIVSADRPALERSDVVSSSTEKSDSCQLVGCGWPWAGQRIAIVDPESGRRVREGGIGEIWVSGPSIAQGYWGRPQETERDFRAHLAETGEGPFLRTGDLGFVHGGELVVTGRLKDLIILRGRNLYPQDLELSAEQSHAELRSGCSAAFSLDVAGEERLILACELERRATAPGEVIADAIRQAVVREHEVQPHEILLLAPGTIPKTSSGKIQRHACRQRYLAGELAIRWRSLRDRPSAETEDGQPAAESRLGREIASLLGVPAADLDPRKSLTSYGLDSLGAVEVQHALESRFGIAVELADLLRGITLEQVTARMLAEPAAPPVRPVPRSDGLTMSFAQERLWFLDRLEPGLATYNIPASVRLEGRLDTEALAASLQEVARRHEALRTTFAMEKGQPVQRFTLPAFSFLPVIDLSGTGGEREVADRLATEESRRGFDLEHGPLWRATLLRLADEEHLLLLTLHHIVSDGWSMGVFARELSALYPAFASGRPSPLPELPVQYADFAVWQRERLSGEVLEGLLARWRHRLEGVPVLELPSDRTPLRTRSSRGASQAVRFFHRLTGPLEELARREGGTLFMALLGGMAAVLSRWTGQDDIALGTAIANRQRAETEGLIGFFANTLVLRTDLSGDPSGRGLLARAREVALAAYADQDLPFERLVQELQPQREAPLIRVVLTLGLDPALGLSLPGLTTEPRLLETGTAKFDLTLQLWPNERGLAGFLEYGTDLFDAPTPHRLIHHLAALLGGIAADPEQRVSGLLLLTPAERHHLVSEWSGALPRPPLEQTIPELFARQVEQRPEAVAVSLQGRQLTYAELDRRANRLARHLRGLGVGPEVPVGVCLDRSLELIVALVAIAKSGGAYVPLDPSHPRKRLALLLARAGAPVVLTRESVRDRVPEPLPGVGRVLCLDSGAGLWEVESAEAPELAADPDSLAYILYTSGSTGEPKGVAVTHRAVVRLVRDTGYASFGPEEVFLQLAPVAFDASTLEIWGPLLNGGRLALAPPGPVAVDELEKVIASEGVTTLWLTAGLFHQVVDQGRGLRGIRQLLAGGDVLSPPHVRRALEQIFGCVVINGYGPTENTTFTCCHRMTGPADVGEPVPIGRPIARTSIFVVEPGGHPSPAGIPGELWVGGDGLARGYAGRSDLTAERFVPHPFGEHGARLYRTGDRVRFLFDGTLEFLGRLDQQVKIRGFRIEPGEIETVLAEHPQVEAAVVVPREVGPEDRRLVAYVVVPSGQGLDERGLRDFAAHRLPGYMVPAAFVALAALPLTPNGKVDRRALPQPDWARGGELGATTLPRNPIEELLVGLWAELLGLASGQVGRDTDFFAAGGHSLLATRLVSRVREDLRVEVPVRGVFEAPTPAGLARLVQAAREELAPPVLPVPRTGSLPLSFAQERLWFLDQLEPGNATYNIPVAVRLAGRLDLPALAASLQEVVHRHEALRTIFGVEQGSPVQRISPPAASTLPRVDLQGLAVRWEMALRLRTEESRRGFDLERGPLWRATLLHLGEQEHVLLLTLHHIVADGWSLGVLVRELSVLYTALAAGRPALLPELPVQYADVAVWQRDRFAAGGLAAQSAYWQRQLAGLEVLRLPTDRLRRPGRGSRGAGVSFHLSSEIRGGLEALARREGVTLFMLLLGGFQALLCRSADQEDVAVGTAIANRNRAETEELIGFFVNTLVLRTDLSGDPGRGEMLRRVREVTLDAYAHQDLPFEKLVEDLAPERDLSRPPLVNVLLVLQNMALPALALPGIEAETLPFASETSRLDLTVTLEAQGDGLTGSVELATDLFDVATVRRMLAHYEQMLAGLAETSGEEPRLSSLPLLTPGERVQLLVEWSGGGAAFPAERCLHELIAAQASARPEAVAVVWGGSRLTYAGLDGRARRLAHHLRGLGVGAETRVGVYLERGPELVPALLGVLKAGGAYVPLDPTYPGDRLAWVLADSGAPVLLVHGGTPDWAAGAGAWVVDLADEESWESASTDLVEVAPANLAYVIYTSGSTGRPKGVGVSHANVVRLLQATDSWFGFGPEDVWTLFHSSAFDFSVWEMWGALAFGGRLVVVPYEVSRSPEDFLALLEVERVTVLNQTPSAFRQLVQAEGGAPRQLSLRLVIFGGEALDLPSLSPWFERHGDLMPRLVNMYGITETTVHVTYRPVSWDDARGGGASLIGAPIPDLTLYIVDRWLQPVPVGVPGEMLVGGAGVARGYLGQPELTAQRFIPDPFGPPGSRLYRSGDLARRRPDGDIEYLGRIDHQVKIRGFRIELGEIETVLGSHPEVEAAVVLPQEVGPEDRRLVAWVVGRPGVTPAADALRSLAASRLPDYMVPAAFVPLAALPLTANGKLDRRALPRPDWSGGEARSASAPPRNPTEELLVGLWADLLGLNPLQVGIDTDFFAAGGHSLLATRLASRVREDLRVEVPVRGVFEAPTPAGLARLVQAARADLAQPVLPVPRTGSLPLSFAQERLWFLDQLEPGNATYNIHVAVRLDGELDILALAASLGEVARRHEVLRTIFRVEQGSPVQRILPPGHPGADSLPIVDLRGLDRPWEAARRLGHEEGLASFDLESGPLWRARLLRLGPNEHLLLLTLHHIVSDGWSMGVLVRELSALYSASVAGQPFPLRELPVQYADVAVWQRQRFRDGGLAAQGTYWKRQLADLTALRLPTDRPHRPARSSRGKNVEIHLSSDIRQGLEALARRERVTLFMVLLAGFQALLARLTDQEDIAVGTAVANRNRAETEDLIGLFVNTLVLRTDLSGDPGSGELLRRVREVTLDAYACQDLPFEKLVQDVAPERDLGRAPLVDVLLVLQNTPLSEVNLPGIMAELLPVSSQRARLDLTLSVAPRGDGLAVWLEFATDLFDEATARRMLARFERVLQAFAGPSEEVPRVSALSLLTPAEQAQLLVEWNDTGEVLSDGCCLHDLVAAQASATPDAPAVICGSSRMTYGELEQQAHRLALHLRALGVGPETPVGVCLERGPELVPALLGILEAGGAYVPLDPSYPRERLLTILEDARVPVLVTQASLVPLASDLATGPLRVHVVDAEREDSAAGTPNLPAEVDPDHLAYLIYTSGSTGRPKGVAITHRSAVAFVRWVADWFSPAELEGILASTSISFDLSIFELFVPLSRGGTVLLVTDALAFAGLPAAAEVTLINTVPSVIAELVRLGPAAPSLRTVNLAGEPVQRILVRQVEKWSPGVRVLNLYGPSEDTTYSTWAVVSGGDGIPPIGRPVTGTSVYLLDRYGNPVPAGVPGELHLGGGGLARGYFGRPDLTAPKFVPDPFAARPGSRLYATGDLARLRPDGNLEFLGRIDHQVKIRGFRIEPGEIEAVLAAHPEVEAVAVVPQEAVPGDFRLVAYLVGRPGQTPGVDELRDIAAARLPGYMVPAAFVLLAALPLTPNGKLDRRALPEPDWTGGAERTATALPRNPTEELLVGLWAELLGLEARRVGIDTDFFTAGGHSLLATRLASRVRENLRVEVPVRAVFEAPTPAGLARLVQAAREDLAPPVLPVPRTGSLPLSFAQERLWFLDQLEPGNATYNIPAAVQMKGRLDVPVLATSLGEIAHRHEALRTTFGGEQGSPVPRVHPTGAVPLPVIDLGGLAGHQEVERLGAEEGRRGFDLERGPLWRATLLRLGEQDHVLLLTLHHIVADGWSLGVLVRELSVLYAASAAGLPAPLPELPVQYADVAVWQREWLSGEVLERQLVYWRRQLAGAPALELPTDRPPLRVRDSRGEARPFQLPSPLAAALEELAHREGATLFMVLLGGFAALLSRCTGQDDISIGTAVANRNRAETEPLIGFFVNTLVLRSDLSGDPTGRGLLARVRDVALSAYAHQDLPFDRLVQELQPLRDLESTPLFRVLLNLGVDPLRGVEIPGLDVEAWPLSTGTAKFDLMLQLTPGAQSLSGALEYRTALFDSPTPQRLVRQLAALLGDMVADPEQKVSGLSLLTAAERHHLLAEWSGAPRPRLEETLPGLFSRQVERRPEAVAVSQGDRRLTYAELDRRANGLAHRLRRLGVGPDVPVGVALERSPELIVALVAIAKSGGAYMPLDPSQPRQRRDFLIAQAGVRIVLTGEDLWELPEEGEAPAPDLHPDHLAYILYTSGSTGEPKGVAVTHRAVVRLVRDTDYASFAPGEVFLQHAPVAFDASTLEIWGPLLNGGRLALSPAGPVALAELEETIAREGITTLWLTAGLFHQVIDQGVSLRGVRQLLAGGDVLSPPHVRRALEQLPGCVLINGYGPTENTTFTCCHRMIHPGEVGTPVPIGRPIARTSVWVLDGEGQPSPAGVPGELWVGGDGLARGYVGRPDLTAERFVPHPFGEPGARLYRTGDRTRFLADGSVEFLGRIDQQVKIRGFRIEPGEIEAVLASHPGLEEVAVVPREVGPDDRRLVAYVVGRPGQVPDADELRELAAARLPGYMIPAVFVALASLPLTPNGKVDRRALPPPDWAQGEERIAAALPRTPAEELLVGLWAELLGLDARQVGVDTDFFAVGGHSLLATRLISRVREDLRVEVPLHGLFEEPTPAGFARLVQAARQGLDAPPIRPVPRTGSLPLSFAQERLWFLDQLRPGDPTYNVPFAVRLEGRLDVPLLAASLGEIARRHEALRTTFGVEGGIPAQRIDSPGPGLLPVVDLSGVAGGREVARRLGDEESRRGFDLERGPVWRAALLRLAAEEHLLLLTLHHIVADGWSLGVFVRELSALHAGARLPELPVQYADFAVWQRERLSAGALDPQSGYWRRQLVGLPVLRLPTDRPRGPERGSHGANVPFHLSPETRAGLAALARREGVTLFMVLLGGFQALLARLADQEDLAVGTAIANRNRAETEDLIGFFVNTLVLRADLSGDPDRRELLRRVRRVTLDAYAHQDLPFEKLVEELAPERDLSRSPLIDVLLVLQNAPLPDFALPGVAAEPLALSNRTARLDLTLSLSPQGEGLAGSAELATGLFDEATVRRLLGSLDLVLRELASPAAEEPRLSTLPLLSAAERAQLLIEWNEAGGGFTDERCLHELFAAQASATPDAIAVVCGSSRLTYREVAGRARRLAGRLRALGVGVETPVGLCLERGEDLVPALLGILQAGGAYVPLDPAYPGERLAMILEDARVPVLVTQASLEARLAEGPARVLIDADLDLEASGPAEASVDPDHLAYFIYTSGSTGRPKGVAITHRSAVALVRWAADRFSAAELAGVLASTSISFDLSVFELFVPLCEGGTVLLAADALALAELPAASAVTLINTVPSAIAELVRLGPPPPGLRTVNLAGEALQRSLVRQVERWQPGVRVLNLYGPSEDTTYSTWAVVSGGPEEAPPIGRPVAGSAVYLLDRHGNPVPLGIPGELHIAGAGLARGYFSRPELTAEKFVPDPFAAHPGGRLYTTGDLARLRSDGNLEFLGRRDQQVKLRGFRIELGEIETTLAGHPAVREAAVLVRDGSLAAWCTLDQPADPAELRSFLRSKLPAHMVPGAVVLLETFPLLPNGKLDRRALPSPAAAPAAEAGRPPRTQLEEVVAGVLAVSLGREGVGMEESFFDLGGHSLLATRAVARLRETLAVDLPVRQIFETPTAATLAAAIERSLGESPEAEPPMARIPRGGPLPLSLSQERLWFLDRLQPASAAYNMPVSLRLRGLVDPGLFAHALNEIVRRHETLRTTFGAVGGQPFQRLAERLELPLPVLDLTALALPERQAELGRQAAAEGATPFDLERGPLLRARLFRLGGEDWVFLIDLHHIVCDGLSLRRLFSELSWLYGAFAAGEPSPLTDLEIQYADYAAWQRRWLQGEVLERHLDYWRRQLAGTLPVLDLPTDRLRPPIQTFHGGSRSALLPAEVAAALHATGRQQGATLFMSMFAAFNLLLHRLSGQEDILVGIPIAGRTRAPVEDLIGFFINSLVLRTDLSGHPGFGELLTRVRRVALDAYAHQDLSFERLLQELRLERDLSRTPLFQVYFNFQGFAGPLPALPGVEVEGMTGEEELSKFDLTLYVMEDEKGEVRLDLVYNAALFSAERCREMLDQYVALLAQAAARPEAGIDSFSLLTPQALRLLPDAAEPLDPSWIGPVHHPLSAWAAADPQRPAVTDPTGTWSYGELEAQSNRLAHLLLAAGLRKGDAVALYAHRSATLVWAVLGVLKAGGAFVALDPSYPPARIVEILRLANPSAWLAMEAAGEVPEPLAGFVAGLPGCLRVELPAWHRGPVFTDLPAEDPDVPVGPDDLAYVAFTSGSTGTPKGVLGRHGPLSHFLPWQCATLGLAASDCFSLLSGLAHDPLQRDIFTPLYLGARICIPDPAEIIVPGKLSTWMRRQDVTVAHLTPAMGQVLTESGQQAAETLPALRYVFLVGDILTRRDVARLQRLAPGVACVNLYGSTETQRAVGYHVVSPAGAPGSEGHDKEVLPLGRGMKDVQLLVRDRAGQRAGIGELGEIAVRSPHLSRGYLGDGETTARKFLSNPATADPGDRLYLTGDLGRYLPNGEVAFAGRADTQVKIRGFRIELGEIESQLGRISGVREAVVLATGDDDVKGRLVAFVALEPAAEVTLSAAELRQRLKAVLPTYMVPSSMIFLPEIPLTPNRKIDRRALLQRASTHREENVSYSAPRTDAELLIAGILREVLGVDRVGAEDNFFDLGGNSLLLLQVQSRVQAAFNRELPVIDLFSHPTVSALARHLAPPEPDAPAAAGDDAAEQLEAGRKRRQRRFQQNQKAAESRPGGLP